MAVVTSRRATVLDVFPGVPGIGTLMTADRARFGIVAVPGVTVYLFSVATYELPGTPLPAPSNAMPPLLQTAFSPSPLIRR